MLVNLACDWGRPSRNWPCAWTPSDYCRFLLSIPRNRFLSTDLQSAFWKRFGKEPSFGFPMDLTNLHALLNDQKGGLSKRIDFASTRIQAAKYTSLLPYGRIGVVFALMVALPVVMYDILLQRSPQRRFSKQDQPRQNTLL